jgi:hypothetical protein
MHTTVFKFSTRINILKFFFAIPNQEMKNKFCLREAGLDLHYQSSLVAVFAFRCVTIDTGCKDTNLAAFPKLSKQINYNVVHTLYQQY